MTTIRLTPWSRFPIAPVMLALFGVLYFEGFTATADAQDVAAAARAFRQAQQADISEQYGRAAELYELADSIAQSPEALRSALRSRIRAGHRAAAAGHAEQLIARYPEDQTSRELAERTLSELRPGLSRVRVVCDDDCSVLVDGASVSFENSTEHGFFVSPGSHQVAAQFQFGETDPIDFTTRAGSQENFEFTAPPPPPDYDPNAPPGGYAQDSGLPPWMFITGAALTVGFGAAATVFGLRTRSLHDDWEVNQGDRDLYDEGRTFQLATNIFMGAAGAAAVGTLILAFLTDWSGGPDEPEEDEDGAEDEEGTEEGETPTEDEGLPVAFDVGFGTATLSLDLDRL